MEQFFNVLSNLGFPIAVASYLLFRMEKKLDNLESTNAKLSESINKYIDQNNFLNGKRR